jgi:hypothetical protein
MELKLSGWCSGVLLASNALANDMVVTYPQIEVVDWRDPPNQLFVCCASLAFAQRSPVSLAVHPCRSVTQTLLSPVLRISSAVAVDNFTFYTMAHQAMRQQHLASSSRTSCSKSIVQQPLVPARRLARQAMRLQQQQLVCMASKLEDVPLFADSSSVGAKVAGAAASSSSSGQKAGQAKLEDIPLNSEV